MTRTSPSPIQKRQRSKKEVERLKAELVALVRERGHSIASAERALKVHVGWAGAQRQRDPLFSSALSAARADPAPAPDMEVHTAGLPAVTPEGESEALEWLASKPYGRRRLTDGKELRRLRPPTPMPIPVPKPDLTQPGEVN